MGGGKAMTPCVKEVFSLQARPIFLDKSSYEIKMKKIKGSNLKFQFGRWELFEVMISHANV